MDQPALLQNPRIRIIAAVVLVALLLLGAGAFYFLRPHADMEAGVAWRVSPAIRSEMDVERLRRTVAATAESALGVRLTLADLDHSLVEELQTKRAALATQEGVTAAQQRVNDLVKTEPGRADTDAFLTELQQTDKTASEAATRLRAKLTSPLIAPPDGVAGAFELTPATGYGAKRLEPSARWLLVPVGSAFVLYKDDEPRQYQAVANQLVQSLAVLAGVKMREGAPRDAMAINIDVNTNKHLERDAGPVRFSAQERAAVREYLKGQRRGQ